MYSTKTNLLIYSKHRNYHSRKLCTYNQKVKKHKFFVVLALYSEKRERNKIPLLCLYETMESFAEQKLKNFLLILLSNFSLILEI